MRKASFTAVVPARLDPILAPRGFPYAANHNGVAAPGEPAVHNPDSVLFHCDGVDSVADLVVRYPSWSTRLRASYGPQEILCLDLWVKQECGERSSDFEIFEDDVINVASADAEQRLASLEAGPLTSGSMSWRSCSTPVSALSRPQHQTSSDNGRIRQVAAVADRRGSGGRGRVGRAWWGGSGRDPAPRARVGGTLRV